MVTTKDIDVEILNVETLAAALNRATQPPSAEEMLDCSRGIVFSNHISRRSSQEGCLTIDTGLILLWLTGSRKAA